MDKAKQLDRRGVVTGGVLVAVGEVLSHWEQAKNFLKDVAEGTKRLGDLAGLAPELARLVKELMRIQGRIYSGHPRKHPIYQRPGPHEKTAIGVVSRLFGI